MGHHIYIIIHLAFATHWVPKESWKCGNTGGSNCMKHLSPKFRTVISSDFQNVII